MKVSGNSAENFLDTRPLLQRVIRVVIGKLTFEWNNYHHHHFIWRNAQCFLRTLH